MQRVITVNLGGNAFALEENGYERLRAYLTNAEGSLQRNPDRAEILGDLERGIGERCLQARQESPGAVITDRAMEQILIDVGAINADPATPGASAPLYAAAAPAAAPATAYTVNPVSDYRRTVVFLLCLLFGWLGVHRYYVGKVGTGVLQMLTIGGLGIWMLIDLILIILGEFTDDDRRRISRW